MGESVKLSLIHIRNFVAPWVRGLIVSDNYPYTLWKLRVLRLVTIGFRQ